MYYSQIASQNIRKLANKNKISIRQLAEQINVPQTTLNSALSSKKGVPIDVLIKIAEFFHTTPQELCGLPSKSGIKHHSEKTFEITLAEKSMVEKYRELDVHGKDVVNMILNAEHTRINVSTTNTYSDYEEDSPPLNVIELNFSEQPSSAGTGYWLDEEQMIPKKVVLNKDTAKADLCIPVSGDSMEPLFHDGDILLVRKQPSVDVGQIGIFTIDGIGYVKKFAANQLESLNPRYEPIPINNDSHFICNGKVLGVLNPAWIVDI